MIKKSSGMLLIGIAALLAAAFGNQGAGSQAPAHYASLYRTAVFLGDSITEGFSYHDVLPEESVLAGAGKTAEFALENVDELVGRRPERVFIQLGSTDILWPTDDPIEYSLSHYATLIESIKARLPRTKITLLAVTPVTAETEQAEPRYKNIGDYNEGLRALAAREDVEYVDLSPLVSKHPGLYDSDGIHFKAAFYPILLDFLKRSIGLTDELP